MVSRFLAVVPIALAAFIGVSASAAPVDCTGTPAQLRAAAAVAAPGVARKALQNINTGEALCAANASYEAGHKFKAAAKLLGLDPALLAAAATPATATN